MTLPPGYTEQHHCSDFSYNHKTPSRLVPGHTTYETRFRCPRCRADTPQPEHGVPTVCLHCGLRMLSYGNGLFLGGEEPASNELRFTAQVIELARALLNDQTSVERARVLLDAANERFAEMEGLPLLQSTPPTASSRSSLRARIRSLLTRRST